MPPASSLIWIQGGPGDPCTEAVVAAVVAGEAVLLSPDAGDHQPSVRARKVAGREEVEEGERDAAALPSHLPHAATCSSSEYDKECKICARPFTVFRWRPARDARYKKTEICQTCCKLKNSCQVCLLDLEYGLPVQVRATALGAINSNDAIPRSDINREYFAEEHDRKVELLPRMVRLSA